MLTVGVTPKKGASRGAAPPDLPERTLTMNLSAQPVDPLGYRGLSVPGVVSEYGPNLFQLNTSLTLFELHQLLDYRVETEIAKSAKGPIAEILRSVQRPATKERQLRIGTYQENYLLKPRPLDEAVEQGYMPAITLLANRPLCLTPIPGFSQMGQTFMLAEKADEDTVIIPSDGVGRITGLENRENLYNKANADTETRRLRVALGRLRIPTLILFPKTGELSELHMQQALYDMNVLATPLTSTLALNRDNRTPYSAIVKSMLADTTANLKQHNLGTDVASLIRFVKIALEGPKVAEKAGAEGNAPTSSDIAKQTSVDLTYFWSVFTSSMAPNALAAKDNMATGAPGITGLALVAHELFFGRGADWSQIEKAAAIRKLGAVDWSRTKTDESGKLVLNKTWAELGLLVLKPDRSGKEMRAVMGGAGANNSRVMTAYLLKLVGLEKPGDDEQSKEKASPDEGVVAA
jgi:hypothetical protein